MRRPRSGWRDRLDYGLEPVNPLDAWGTGHDWEGIFRDCLAASDAGSGYRDRHPLRRDPRAAYFLHEGYADVVRDVAAQTEKPMLIANNIAAVGNDDLAVRLTA